LEIRTISFWSSAPSTLVWWSFCCTRASPTAQQAQWSRPTNSPRCPVWRVLFCSGQSRRRQESRRRPFRGNYRNREQIQWLKSKTVARVRHVMISLYNMVVIARAHITSTFHMPNYIMTTILCHWSWFPSEVIQVSNRVYEKKILRFVIENIVVQLKFSKCSEKTSLGVHLFSWSYNNVYSLN